MLCKLHPSRGNKKKSCYLCSNLHKCHNTQNVPNKEYAKPIKAFSLRQVKINTHKKQHSESDHCPTQWNETDQFCISFPLYQYQSYRPMIHSNHCNKQLYVNEISGEEGGACSSPAPASHCLPQTHPKLNKLTLNLITLLTFCRRKQLLTYNS